MVYEINRIDRLSFATSKQVNTLTLKGEKNKVKEIEVQDERVVGKYFAVLQLVQAFRLRKMAMKNNEKMRICHC